MSETSRGMVAILCFDGEKLIGRNGLVGGGGRLGTCGDDGLSATPVLLPLPILFVGWKIAGVSAARRS